MTWKLQSWWRSPRSSAATSPGSREPCKTTAGAGVGRPVMPRHTGRSATGEPSFRTTRSPAPCPTSWSSPTSADRPCLHRGRFAASRPHAVCHQSVAIPRRLGHAGPAPGPLPLCSGRRSHLRWWHQPLLSREDGVVSASAPHPDDRAGGSRRHRGAGRRGTSQRSTNGRATSKRSISRRGRPVAARRRQGSYRRRPEGHPHRSAVACRGCPHPGLR